MRTDQQTPALDLPDLLQATERKMLDILLPTAAHSLDELVIYHLSSGGGRTRAKLALHAARAMDLPREVCVGLAACCELIHNASLLHDDIQDQDSIRRDRTAAWRQFDTNTAMCAGTLMLSAAYQALAQIEADTSRMVMHVHARTADLIAGQTRDLASLDEPISLDDYLEIAAGKSGSLLALPLELALIASGQTEALPLARQAGESFAAAYQMIDDMMDIEADEQNGHNNIVMLFIRSGKSMQEAMEQSANLARIYLDAAVIHAGGLPHQSGQFLVKLSEKLRVSIDTLPELNSEVV